MSLSEIGGGNGLYMPVAPAYGGGQTGNLNEDWGWIIILLLLAGIGGWGRGGFGGGGYGDATLSYDFPWLLTGQQNINSNTSNGFRDAMLNNNISSINDGIHDLSSQICNGTFNLETSMLQGFNGVQSQLAQCCCDNRLATANLSADIAREACATRTNDTQNTQAILNVVNGGIQSIKDQLCQDKIDEKNDTIAQLRQEVLYARGQASQDVQTARLLAGQTTEVDALYNRLSQCPVPCMPVYGMQPIFTCNNGGCGCSGNNF